MEKIKQEEFTGLVTYMRRNYGVNLEQKLTLVEGRLSSTLDKRGFKNLGEYVEFVKADKSGGEAKALLTKLTTNYTYFYREKGHYEYLVSTILPHYKATLKDKDLRTWSAGCSSGEEPYTTAIVYDDFFGLDKNSWDSTILATDISQKVLGEAQTAEYPVDHLDEIREHKPQWEKKYFTKAGADRIRVNDNIRKEVRFGPFNLMDQMPWKRKFHVIFCRNVMIYFDKPTRDALIERFYDALEIGGHLFIGMSETADKTTTRFTFVKPSIYRRDK